MIVDNFSCHELTLAQNVAVFGSIIDNLATLMI